MNVAKAILEFAWKPTSEQRLSVPDDLPITFETTCAAFHLPLNRTDD